MIETLVRVELGARGYDIVIGAGCLANIGQRLQGFAKRQRIFVLSDETVWELYGETLEAALAGGNFSTHAKTVAVGEATKNWDQLGDVLNWLLDAGAGRDDILIAFGGGVVGDLTGLAASLMKRGMMFVQVPTTLLAQVDSSVGGKTAINTSHGKNLIGAFYQPKLVIADTDLLKTLPPRECRAGYAEIIKYGFIDDPDFVSWLEVNGPDVLALEPEAIAHAVAVSCRSKARIVAQDEREGGIRALLNLGHTFGHTLEAANNYGPALLHGEAIGTGMALALKYSARAGLMTEDDAARGCSLIAKSGLQPNLCELAGGPYLSPNMAAAMKQDKKVRAGRVPLILTRGLGKAFIHPNADLNDVESFLEQELNPG